MRSISRTLIESSWNLSIEPDRANEETLQTTGGWSWKLTAQDRRFHRSPQCRRSRVFDATM
jgi:hypothetical protein